MSSSSYELLSKWSSSSSIVHEAMQPRLSMISSKVDCEAYSEMLVFSLMDTMLGGRRAELHSPHDRRSTREQQTANQQHTLLHCVVQETAQDPAVFTSRHLEMKLPDAGSFT